MRNEEHAAPIPFLLSLAFPPSLTHFLNTHGSGIIRGNNIDRGRSHGYTALHIPHWITPSPMRVAIPLVALPPLSRQRQTRAADNCRDTTQPVPVSVVITPAPAGSTHYETCSRPYPLRKKQPHLPSPTSGSPSTHESSNKPRHINQKPTILLDRLSTRV